MADSRVNIIKLTWTQIGSTPGEIPRVPSALPVLLTLPVLQIFPVHLEI